MGKSGYLPSISAEFLFWKQYSVNCLSDENYQGAQAGLYNLNQCLTDEYVVTISTKQYNEEMKDMTVFQCEHCTMERKEILHKGEEDEIIKISKVPTEIHYSKIEILEKKCTTLEKAILGFSKNEPNIQNLNLETSFADRIAFQRYSTSNDTRKYFICPKCNSENFQKEGQWNTIKSIREQPFSLGVVPEPPLKPPYLSDSLGYPKKFKVWFYNFLEEIQAKMVLYRIEYVSQTGHDMEDTTFKDKGDHGNN